MSMNLLIQYLMFFIQGLVTLNLKLELFCGEYRSRTDDLLRARQAL